MLSLSSKKSSEFSDIKEIIVSSKEFNNFSIFSDIDNTSLLLFIFKIVSLHVCTMTFKFEIYKSSILVGLSNVIFSKLNLFDVLISIIYIKFKLFIIENAYY